MGVMFPNMSRAQKSKRGEKNIISSKINQIAKKYGDTISHLSQYYKTKWKYSKSDTLANPFYFHLFSPTIVSSEQFKGMLSRPNDAKDGQVQQEIEKIILQSYADYPMSFQYEDFRNIRADK